MQKGEVITNNMQLYFNDYFDHELDNNNKNNNNVIFQWAERADNVSSR